MKKRMMAWLLIVAMMASQFPTAAFATENGTQTEPTTAQTVETSPAKKSTEPTKAGEKSTEPTKATEETKSTEGTEASDPTETTVETQPEETETEPSTEPATEPSTEPVDEAVAAVEGAIAALPALDALEAMDESSQSAAYEQAQAIADAYDALTEDQQGKVANFETLKAFLEWFAVPETMAVVRFGNQGEYDSFDDAFSLAKDGYTLILLQDAEFNGSSSVWEPNISKNITIQLAGHTLYAKAPAVLGSNIGYTYVYVRTNPATIQGPGTIGGSYGLMVTGFDVIDDSYFSAGTATLTGGVSASQVNVDNGATLNLQNANITNLYVTASAYHNTTLNMSGGSAGALYVEATSEKTKVAVNLTGGSFTKIERKGSAPAFSAMLAQGNVFLDSSNNIVDVSDTSKTTLTNVHVGQCPHGNWKEEKGKINCGHCGYTCTHSGVTEDNRTCGTCGKVCTVKEDWSDGGTDKVRWHTSMNMWVYYLDDTNTLTLYEDAALEIPDDISAESGVMLWSSQASTFTLNLNGHTLTSAANKMSHKTLSVNGGTLDGYITAIANGEGEYPGHIHLANTTVTGPVTFCACEPDEDVLEAGVTLQGGVKTTAEGKHLSDYLASGTVFTRNGNVVNATNLTELTGEVKVVKCTADTHSYVNGVCEYCGDVCNHPAVDGDNKCTGCGLEMAVKKADGSAYYPTLAAALKNNGDYILLKDVTEDVRTSVVGSLDLNGKNITGTLKYSGGTFDTLTLKGNGNVTSLEAGSWGGKVCLEGGTYGTLSGGGGYFVGSFLAAGYALQKDSSYIPWEELSVTSVNNVTVVKCTHAGSDRSPCPYCNTVLEASVTAGTTTTGYATFEEALTAANSSSGSTLKLLTNVNITSNLDATGTFTLDLNGKNLDGRVLIVRGGDVTIQDSVSGGILGLLAANQNGKVTLSSGIVGTLSLDGGTVTVNGGKVRRELDVVAGNNNGTYANTLKITGGEIESINIWTDVSLTITGGTIKVLGVGQNVQQSGESITVTSAISGGTFGGVNNNIGNVRDLLADGYALYSGDNVVNAAVNTLDAGESNYYQVKSHTHIYVNGSCDCGYACPHTTVTNNKCGTCEQTFVAQLWRNNTQVGWLTKIGDTDGLVDAIQAGDTVKLIGNIKGLSSTAYLDKSITLNLNGFRISACSIEANGVTIIDSSVGDGQEGGYIGAVETNEGVELTLGAGVKFDRAIQATCNCKPVDGCGFYKVGTQGQYTWVETIEEKHTSS